MIRFRWSCVAALVPAMVYMPSAAWAEGPDPLPEPLSLAYALSLADDPHPDLLKARAELSLRKADERLSSSDTDVDVSLRARLGWVEPSRVASSQSHHDAWLSLVMRKRLYDFGRTDAAVKAGSASVAGQEARLLAHRQQRRLDILQSYLDVSLADLRYMRDNEAMAIAFIRFDDLQDEHELGQASDVELLARQAAFLESRTQRAQSEARQRTTRSRLAQMLNRPGQLSSDVEIPRLPGARRALPDFEELEKRMLESNLLLQALRRELNAAELRVAEAAAGSRPVIDGSIEASAYSRKLGSSDPWRGGIEITVPLYSGNRVRAQTAQRRAELVEISSALALSEMEMRQQLLELYLELQTLYGQREEVEIGEEYADVNLERSRALYELEVGANFGDSLVQTSSARLRKAENEYNIALTWAGLDAMTGTAPEQIGVNLLQGVEP